VDCEVFHPASNTEFLDKWLGAARSRHVPLTGGLELTQRCNLRCLHCYLGEQDEIRQRRSEELNAAQWCDIIDQIAAAGTLWLLLTGGEPLLRGDFEAIYTHAKMRGLLVAVFTNGTLVGDETIALFRRLPPFKIEISLYGASEVTYEKITGIDGSYARCMRGVRSLAESGVRLSLKTVLMTHNAHEFAEIERLAGQLGDRFRFDAEVQPRFSGDKLPLALRLTPAEAVGKEFSDPRRRQEWRGFSEKRRSQAPAFPERLYSCSAGTSNFFVDAYGSLHPCLMVRDIGYDLTAGRFADGWRMIGEAITMREAPADFTCNLCEHRMVCSSCPAFAKLESGSERVPSPYQCAMMHERAAQSSDSIWDHGDRFDE
jgi:radical SAM protein with 4Fe4S-binding SPASM domain